MITNKKQNAVAMVSFTVKPPIKDTPREDKPPNKGQT